MSAVQTDETLRIQALFTNEPLKQAGLLQVIPDGAKLVDLLNLYETEKREVRCVACHALRHRKGFTGLLDNGRRVLLGSVCGAKAFGESWNEAHDRFCGRRNRQQTLAFLDRFSDIHGDLRRKLYGWKSPLASAIAKVSSFQRSTGALASRLNEAAQDGGQLTVTEQLEHVGSSERGVKTHQSVTRIVGSFKGSSVFTQSPPVKVLERAHVAMKKADEGLRRSGELSNSQLTRLETDLRRSFRELKSASQFVDASNAFIQIKNIEMIVSWTQLPQVDHVVRHQLKGRHLHCESQEEALWIIPNPTDLDPEPLQIIDEVIMPMV